LKIQRLEVPTADVILTAVDFTPQEIEEFAHEAHEQTAWFLAAINADRQRLDGAPPKRRAPFHDRGSTIAPRRAPHSPLDQRGMPLQTSHPGGTIP
jgi:hypothetical protein